MQCEDIFLNNLNYALESHRESCICHPLGLNIHCSISRFSSKRIHQKGFRTFGRMQKTWVPVGTRLSAALGALITDRVANTTRGLADCETHNSTRQEFAADIERVQGLKTHLRCRRMEAKQAAEVQRRATNKTMDEKSTTNNICTQCHRRAAQMELKTTN